MKERIREIAGELIKTAAERALRPGAVVEPDTGYAAFVDRFPYEETEDQDRAIARRDRRSRRRPADGPAGLRRRRLRQDRGRACAPPSSRPWPAFRSPWSARPPCSPASITTPSTSASRASRSRSGASPGWSPPRRRRRPKDGLEAGKIDIVIGTHALLAKSVEFKNLGLVIVDEEQRFGVTHKERLKALRADVHVLTLTATPIPRTLQMAMSGLRELSRHPDPAGRPAGGAHLRHALGPGGGPRGAAARTLSRRPELLRRAADRRSRPTSSNSCATRCPRSAASPPTARWRRPRSRNGCRAFYDRKYDVLLSTTIVESGLDIPSANTLIVHRADRFGLAQLYQLRGRVGRAKTRAYAYLTTPADPDRHRDRRQAPEGARQSRFARRRLPARQPRSRHSRRRQSARRRAIGPYQGGRLRALPVDARGGDHDAKSGRRLRGRRPISRRRSRSTRRS